ncbi:ankyrin repeat-containing domain protein [Annulohypoxylon moriforme]|nr:ankyrin repeat-containing domain protein [Annulohypoxylon moriforme]
MATSDDARARDGITNRGKGPECASFLYAKNKEFASLRGCGGLPDQYETEEEIKRYLSYEGTKSYIDDEGGTLLHLIGEFTPLYIIKLLVEGGVPADTPNNIGCTPLVVAVGSKNTAAAEYLISLKANVNVKSGTSSAITLAQIACFNGSPEILKFLVGAGAELFTTNNKFRGILLHTALSERSFSSQSVELIRYLVDDLGSDVNAISSYGIFPVLKAASLQLSKGSPESKILGFLISRKADLNTSDAEGRRAVHIASIGKKSHGLEMLVEAGADINVEDNYGRRPIHFAAGCSQECLEYILDRRVDINVPDHDGWTPLMWAVRSGEEGSIRKLMRMGADIWCRGRGYETEWSALKLARFWDLWEDPDILKLLMPQRSARKTANGRVEEWEKEFHRTHPAHHKMTLCTSCTMVRIK